MDMTQIIVLENGIRIEAQPSDSRVSKSLDGKVQQSIDALGPLLKDIVRPLAAAWKDISNEIRVEKAEIELGFGIETTGQFFLASAKGNVNLKVKLSITRIGTET